jgi:plastocyanin
MSARLRSAAAVIAVVPIAFAAAPAGGAAGPTVAIVDLHYRPSPVTIQVGQTVTWNNEGFENHTVTSVSGEFDSGTIRGEKQFSLTFTKPGTFPYTCTFHPIMKGTVIVTGHATTPPPSEHTETAPVSGPSAPPASVVSLQLRHQGAHTRLLVTSSPPGARVLLEIYSREHFAWLQVAHAKLNASGTATFTLKAGLRRPVRAVVLGSAGGTSISATHRT